MTDQKQLQMKVRFPETIDGFNEEFARLLYNHLASELTMDRLYTTAVGRMDHPHKLSPGCYEMASHLAEQIKHIRQQGWEAPDYMLGLLSAAATFLKVIEPRPVPEQLE